ncbi:hypothetical protein P152DRAFT_452505 [Eremomyces bilateralis CBS 781.70]|uniref:Uncharacterized protein n=1 Tax=Eremomyces bilateralis CBS 781.70 TaxID=1392243 RepID=A0A6G1FT55_9PEZI|nr:uncharacterized protein P152DRAFT_452505 [Eremomyces bilateralis CBS 781.70]KAF1808851.1 hypothetical protein P152DRAFT_452505 [Eremomyces bilateralis CBS 781.70]
MPARVFKAPSKDALIYLRNIVLFSSAATVAGGAAVHVYNDFRQIKELRHRIERTHQVNSLLRHFSAAANDVYIPKDKFILDWEEQHGPIGPKKKRKRKDKDRKGVKEESPTRSSEKKGQDTSTAQRGRPRPLLARWLGHHTPSHFDPIPRGLFKNAQCRHMFTSGGQAVAMEKTDLSILQFHDSLPTPMEDFEAAFTWASPANTVNHPTGTSKANAELSTSIQEEVLHGDQSESDEVSVALHGIQTALKTVRPWATIGAILHNLPPEARCKSVWLQPRIWSYLAQHQAKDAPDDPEPSATSLFQYAEASDELAKNFTTLFVHEEFDIVLPRLFISELLSRLGGPIHGPDRFAAWRNVSPILSWLHQKGMLDSRLKTEFFLRWVKNESLSDHTVRERYELFSGWAMRIDPNHKATDYLMAVLERMIRSEPLAESFSWLEKMFDPATLTWTWMTAITSHTRSLLDEGNVKQALDAFASGANQLHRELLQTIAAGSPGAWIDTISLLLDSAIGRAKVSREQESVELSLVIASMLCRTGAIDPDWDQLESLLRPTVARKALLTYLQYLPDQVEPSLQMQALARRIDHAALHLPAGPMTHKQLFSYMRNAFISQSPVETILDYIRSLRPKFSSTGGWAVAWHKALCMSAASPSIFALFDQLIQIPVPLTETEARSCQRLQAHFLQLSWETKGDVRSVCATFEHMTKYSDKSIGPVLSDRFVWIIGRAQDCGEMARYLQLPNIQIYPSTRPLQIVALAKKGDWESVARLTEMPQVSDLDRETASQLLRDLSRQLCKQFDVDCAFSVCQSLIESMHLPPSPEALANLMEKALSDDKPGLIKDMLKEFKRHREPIDDAVKGNIIQPFIKWAHYYMPNVALVQEFVAILHEDHPKSVSKNFARVAINVLRREARSASRLLHMIQVEGSSSPLLEKLELMAKDTVEAAQRSMRNVEQMKTYFPTADERRRRAALIKDSPAVSIRDRRRMDRLIYDAQHYGERGDAARLFQKFMDQGIVVSRTALKIAISDLLTLGSYGEAKAYLLLNEVEALGQSVDANRLTLPIHSGHYNLEETPDMVLKYVAESWRIRKTYDKGIVATGASNLISNGMIKEAIAMLDTVYHNYPSSRPALVMMTLYAIAFSRIGSMKGLQWVVNTVLDKRVPVDNEFLFVFEQARLASRPESIAAHRKFNSEASESSLRSKGRVLDGWIGKIIGRMNEQARTAAEVAKILLDDHVPSVFVDKFGRVDLLEFDEEPLPTQLQQETRQETQQWTERILRPPPVPDAVRNFEKARESKLMQSFGLVRRYETERVRARGDDMGVRFRGGRKVGVVCAAGEAVTDAFVDAAAGVVSRVNSQVWCKQTHLAYDTFLPYTIREQDGIETSIKAKRVTVANPFQTLAEFVQRLGRDKRIESFTKAVNRQNRSMPCQTRHLNQSYHHVE